MKVNYHTVLLMNIKIVYISLIFRIEFRVLLFYFKNCYLVVEVYYIIIYLYFKYVIFLDRRVKLSN